MKKAHPLTAVLRLRALAEEQEERLLEKILLERSRIDELVRKHREAIVGAYSTRAAKQAFVSAVEVQEAYAHVSDLSERVTKFENQKHKLRDLADQQRGVLQKARQQRETVESLLDKHREQVELGERRSEQRTLDDIHGAQRIRKQIAQSATSKPNEIVA